MADRINGEMNAKIFLWRAQLSAAFGEPISDEDLLGAFALSQMREPADGNMDLIDAEPKR